MESCIYAVAHALWNWSSVPLTDCRGWVGQMRRANCALANMLDNISDVIREAEVSTPLGIVHSIRGYEEKQGYEVDPRGTNGVRTKFSPSPEGFSARSLFNSLGDLFPSPPVDVGGYTHDF